jgi:hypothetical protein
VAGEAYDAGLPLTAPDHWSRREISLALAYYDALVTSEPDRWWSDLPLPALPRDPER